MILAYPKFKDTRAWSRWFAWYPVTLLSGHVVWWQDVDRRWEGSYDAGGWVYRFYVTGPTDL